jgi:asparagine synthase (glutamine-hydrolysing)
MSHFLLICDTATENRNACIQAAKKKLSQLGLLVQSTECDSFAAAWACSMAFAGESVVSDSGACLLMGQALDDGGVPVRAASLNSHWATEGGAVPKAFDGIFMAATSRQGELTVGADVLGRFPVYYWATPERIVVASSPELFKAHPLFERRLDTRALAGLLMLNYFTDGGCLWKGVRRLGAGNLLRYRNGRATESPQYRMPFSDEYFGLTLDQQGDLIDGILRECIEDHLRGHDRAELFCSGGLDSRMLAGYVQRSSKVRTAITWGDPDDFEMLCAGKVVRKLGITHEKWPVQFPDFPTFARRSVEWQGLSIGFTGLAFWQGRQTPAAPGGFLSGQAMDAAIGGTVVLSYKANTGFKDVMTRDGAWAVPVPVLRRLLRSEVFNGEIDAAQAAMDKTFEDFAPRDYQRVNGYNLLHRHRFHTTCVIGLHGFWGWPILPAMDRRVLRVIAGLPKDSFPSAGSKSILYARAFRN